VVKGHFQAFQEVTLLLTKHRELTLAMAKRELSDRYVGQALGMLWVIGHPLFLTGLYIFVFSVVFKTRLGGTVEMPLDYTTYVLSGLVAWLAFSEAMSKSCVAITANASLVKQVVFPLEILPVKTVLASLVTMLVSLVVLVAYVLITHGTLPLTYALLPVVVVMQLLLMTGVSYILSSVGAYFRDIKDFVQMFSTAGIFLLPVVYLPGWVPPLFKPIIYLNPLSYLIWCYQDILYFGRFEHPWAWVVTPIISTMTFVAGYRLFRKLRPYLAGIV
jgi:lipopolysaccharide transport system permease protein